MTVNELEAHFLTELDRLYKLSSGAERQRLRANFNMSSGMHPTNGILQGPDSRWEVGFFHHYLHILNVEIISDISKNTNQPSRSFKGENTKTKK